MTAWERFVHEVQRKNNLARKARVAEELAVMRPLVVARLPEHVELDVKVSEWSTIRVKNCAYSVPSRLRHEWVRVHLHEDRLDIHYAGKSELVVHRLRGDNRHLIDYRHVILVARAEAGRVRAVRLPRGDVPDGDVSAAATTRSNHRIEA